VVRQQERAEQLTTELAVLREEVESIRGAMCGARSPLRSHALCGTDR
jgi:hypothetical protein